MEQRMLSATIFVNGRVQGVGFRYFVYQNIISNYPLTGYVRNLRDGQVEVFLEGDKDVIEAALPLIERGPSHSYVTDMRVEWDEYRGEYRDFNIKM